MMFDPKGLNSMERKVVKTKAIHSYRTVLQILWLTRTSKMSFPPILASKRERKVVLVISLLCVCSRYLYIHYLINQAICQPNPSRKIA